MTKDQVFYFLIRGYYLALLRLHFHLHWLVKQDTTQLLGDIQSRESVPDRTAEVGAGVLPSCDGTCRCSVR